MTKTGNANTGVAKKAKAIAQKALNLSKSTEGLSIEQTQAMALKVADNIIAAEPIGPGRVQFGLEFRVVAVPPQPVHLEVEVRLGRGPHAQERVDDAHGPPLRGPLPLGPRVHHGAVLLQGPLALTGQAQQHRPAVIPLHAAHKQS